MSPEALGRLLSYLRTDGGVSSYRGVSYRHLYLRQLFGGHPRSLGTQPCLQAYRHRRKFLTVPCAHTGN